MPGLKINLDDLESESEDSAKMSHEGLHLGKITVSFEGLTTSMGHKYILSPEDIVLSATVFLGKGSSGSVRRVMHRKMKKEIALKEIKVTSHGHMQEIRRELETLHCCGSTSPYLVDFYGAFFNEGAVFIAMECMDGSLDSVKKPVPVRVLASISRSILRALFYLHKKQHLIHRDLKPSNLLYSFDGRIKVSDFGVSSCLECTRGSALSFVGTLTYMSPERLKGEPYSFAADIWSFGLVVAELALGKCPFLERLGRGETSESCFWVLLQHLDSDRPAIALPPSMDPLLGEFISKCSQKDPTKRPMCDELLMHPFIAKYEERDDEHVIKQWLSTMQANVEVVFPSECKGKSMVPPLGMDAPINLDEELNRLLQ